MEERRLDRRYVHITEAKEGSRELATQEKSLSGYINDETVFEKRRHAKITKSSELKFGNNG